MTQTLVKAIAARCLTIWLLLLAVTICALANAQIAGAEGAYPSRPIRLIVPFPPGGPTDVMGRLISQGLSDQLGQQVYVDNRPGAGSTLAGKIAANAEPDGYTLLLGSAATLAIGPALYRDAEYDPKRFMAENGVPDFTASSWTGIVAPPGTPKAIVDKLNRATNAALKDPATQAKLKTFDAQPMFGSPADYANFLKSELPKWTNMAKLSGAGAE